MPQCYFALPRVIIKFYGVAFLMIGSSHDWGNITKSSKQWNIIKYQKKEFIKVLNHNYDPWVKSMKQIKIIIFVSYHPILCHVIPRQLNRDQNKIWSEVVATLKNQYNGIIGGSDGVERQQLAFIQQQLSSPFLESMGLHIRWNFESLFGICT